MLCILDEEVSYHERTCASQFYLCVAPLPFIDIGYSDMIPTTAGGSREGACSGEECESSAESFHKLRCYLNSAVVGRWSI